MSNKTKISPDQGAMFVQSTYRNFEHPVDLDAIAPPVEQVTPPTYEDGPSVNIIDRAHALEVALKGLADMSRTSGLEKASVGPQRRELEQHMEDVDAVVGHSAAAQPHRLRAVKQAFATALGNDQVVASGLMTKEEAQASAREDFQHFTDKFAEAAGSKQRNSKRRVLKRSIDIAHGLPRRRKPRNAA